MRGSFRFARAMVTRQSRRESMKSWCSPESCPQSIRRSTQRLRSDRRAPPMSSSFSPKKIRASSSVERFTVVRRLICCSGFSRQVKFPMVPQLMARAPRWKP